MAPIEGVLLYCSSSLLHVFQSSHVSSLYFCVFMLTLVGENCRWSETTAFLLEFPIGKSTNRSTLRELSYVEVQCKVMFFIPTSCVAGLEWSSVTSKKVRYKKLAAIGCYCKTWRRWTTNSAVEPKRRLSFIDDWWRCCCSWLKWSRGGATSVFMAHTGGVLRREANDVFFMQDMDKQCFHRRLCRHSLSTLEVRHLFKQIEFSYFTFWCSQFPFDKKPCQTPFSTFLSLVYRPWVKEPIFHPGACMINVWTCNLYDELTLRGVTYGRNSCMMKHESWFLPKLYNENFLSDGHCVTHKSWVQDASRRVCLDANNNSTYNLRTGSIHCVNMDKFSIWSQKGLISAQWWSS